RGRGDRGGPRPALRALRRESAWPGRGAPPRRRAGGDRGRPPLGGGRRDAARSGACSRRPIGAGGRPGPGERAEGDRGDAPLGGRRELEPGVEPGNQGSPAATGLRGGSAMTALYGDYGGRYVPETLIP